MNTMRVQAAAALAGLLAMPAAAQTVSIVTTPAGSYTNSVGAAVAKTIFDKAKVRVVVRPQATIGFDEVDSASAEFNVSNSFDSAFFATGTADYEGRGPKPDLRLVGALLPFRVAMHVRANSAIRTMADLKGKRVSSGFLAQKTVGRIIEAHLANAGLRYDDVVKIPAPNIASSTQDFTGGKVDAVYLALGSSVGKQAAATVGGLRVLEIDCRARRRQGAAGPAARRLPDAGRSGARARRRDGSRLNLVAFDMVLNTSARVPDDVDLQGDEGDLRGPERARRDRSRRSNCSRRRT